MCHNQYFIWPLLPQTTIPRKKGGIKLKNYFLSRSLPFLLIIIATFLKVLLSPHSFNYVMIRLLGKSIL